MGWIALPTRLYNLKRCKYSRVYVNMLFYYINVRHNPHNYSKAINNVVWLDKKAVYDKTDFLAIFQKFWELAFTPDTIKSAFKKTGLVPYFLDIVFDKIWAEIAKEKPRTRPAASASILVSSEKKSLFTHISSGTFQEFMATFCIFDQYIKQHIKDIAKDNLSACLSEIYSKFSKGVEAKLHSGALAED